MINNKFDNHENLTKEQLLGLCDEYSNHYRIGWNVPQYIIDTYQKHFIITEFDEEDRGYCYMIFKERNNITK